MAGMLQDKVIVITGAGGGIGREFAIGMAAAGARIVVNDVGATLSGAGSDRGAARAVVDEITSAGGTAVASTENITDPKAAESIIQFAIERFGRVDGLINNAGILRDHLVYKMSVEDWKAVIDVHLHGSFYMSRAVLPFFKEQSAGALVHIVSTSGLIGNIGQGNYAAAKMAMVGLSRTIANEMTKYNVRSNCIAPFAWSRMISSIPTDTPAQQARVERLKKMEARKVPPLATFLCSDEAKDISGQIFCVRANEIFLMSQIRPLRSVHNGDGWTPETIATAAIPALRSHFYGFDKSADVFAWDPI
jgi:NAD(P)-dependent dehydrogenase (short-subunit alcohol dehydrogenase family)